ncbi:MAG: lysophospholipid acyltransferase family protein [Actinomycetota bacterium]
MTPERWAPDREPVYRTVVAAALAWIRAMGWKVVVSGEEHVPKTGPAIIASNHVGYLDFVFLGVAARERGRLVRFMAMQEAFGHWLGGPLLRGMHHIPVDRSKGQGAAALSNALRALEAGEVIGLHPESRISRTLRPGAAKSGAARMAIASGAPLIPAAVWGTQRLLARGRRPRLPRGVAITVKLGPPIEVDGSDDAGEVTTRLMDRIGELVDAAMISNPQRPRHSGEAWWWPARLGGTAPVA